MRKRKKITDKMNDEVRREEGIKTKIQSEQNKY